MEARSLAMSKLKYTIADMQRIAEKRCGVCLSQEYSGVKPRLEWMCSNGHKWLAAPHHIIAGRWCNLCSIESRRGKTKYSIKDMKDLAKSRGGMCLSSVFENVRANLEWQCSLGHRWVVPARKIIEGHWCRRCSAEKQKGRGLNNFQILKLGEAASAQLLEINLTAKRRGGECLSNTYDNNRVNLRFRCGEGHEWEATAHNFKKGTWCPVCAGNQRASLKEMQLYANTKNGKCLSLEYSSTHIPLEWQCERGHAWKASPSSILRGHWCPICSGYFVTIEDMQRLAQDRGGRCLSTHYEGYSIKLKWQCRDNHSWEAKPTAIVRGSWCPHCSVRFNYGEEICRLYFEAIFNAPFPKSKPDFLKRGRSFLELDGFNQALGIAFEHHGIHHYRFVKKLYHSNPSEFEALKVRDKLKLKLCAQNGVAVAVIPEIPTLTSIESVPEFIKAELTRVNVPIPKSINGLKLDLNQVFNYSALEEIKRIAVSKGGVLLTESYLGANFPVEIRCSAGHIFKSRPVYIRSGKWCSRCAGNYPSSILEMQLLAASKNGLCLSTDYRNKNEKLEWQCEKGHRWLRTPSNMKGPDGSWCSICRRERRKPADAERRLKQAHEIARRHGGKFLSTESLSGRHKHEWQCACGYQWAATFYSVTAGSWCPRCGDTLPKSITDAKKIAKKQGGSCESSQYKNNRQKLLWKCKYGHSWSAALTSIQGGTWCPFCAGTKKKSINDAHSLAASKGGRCLSKRFINSRTKLQWECVLGHRWKIPLANVTGGSWCPECHKHRLGGKFDIQRQNYLSKVQDYARKRGGICLATEYVNNEFNMEWQCALKHRWSSSFRNVRRGRWCPVCGGSQPKTLGDAKELAASRGGLCLSRKFEKASTKLFWKCEFGHRWEATYTNVKRGTWCAECWSERKGWKARQANGNLKSLPKA